VVAAEDEDRPCAVTGRSVQAEVGVLAKDLPLEFAQEWRGLDPELGVECLARAAVDVECVCLPAGPVEGAHQRADEALVHRVVSD
jgi:hypothetical protein